MRSALDASARSRFWSSLIALAILGAHAMRACCVPTAVGTMRSESIGAVAPALFGRHAHPVVRLGFKPSGGRQPFPGRFDSCYLPPSRLRERDRLKGERECPHRLVVLDFTAPT